jgi:hypothetical protein
MRSGCVQAEIETWWQIQQLMTRYALACDDRDWTRYREVFTTDALIDYTEAYGRAGSVDEIVPWIERIMSRELLPSSQHMLANLDYRSVGDTASGRVHYFNPDVFVENGRKVGLINGGVYRFEARRQADGWRLTRLHARLLWSTRAELTEFATTG